MTTNMLTREQIKTNIEAGSGKWEPEKDFIFRMDDSDNTLHIDWITDVQKYQAFLVNSRGEDMGSIYLASMGELKNINYIIKFVKKISEYVGYDLNIDEAKTVQMPVRDKGEESRLAGKVEAYENLLLNREINISK